MAVKIRLRRVGAKKQPAYRVVVADSRAPRDGRFIETIGYYNPLTNPPTIVIDNERATYWMRQGAQPTDVVKHMIEKSLRGETGVPAPVVPAEIVAPVTETAPVTEEVAVVEEAAVTEEVAVVEETPVASEEVAVAEEAAPVTEEAPAAAEITTTEETPAE